MDDTIVEEMAQHAAEAFEAAHAEGQSVTDAEATVRGLISTWCELTGGSPSHQACASSSIGARKPLLFAGLGLDFRLSLLEPWPRSTIIGVMPQGFEWPSSAARLWVRSRDLGPVVTHPVMNGRTMTMFSLSKFNALARLKPGFTAEQAAAEATGRVNAPGGDFASARERVFGGDGTARVRVVPLLEWSLQDVQPALWMLLAAVGLLFAAAIGNVVNLQLARAAKRQQEVAVRTAIGAGGARLARQLFVETLPIAVIGGALGFAITAALLRLLPTLLPANFPRVQEVALDGRVLRVAVGLTFLVSILTGLLPMRLARRLKLTAVLADAGSAPTTVRARAAGARSRALIIASQVAVAALLLVGAALLGQSFLRMVAVDRGYELANVLTAHVFTSFVTVQVASNPSNIVQGRLLGREAFPAGPGERVDLDLAPAVGFSPRGPNPARLLQFEQGGHRDAVRALR